MKIANKYSRNDRSTTAHISDVSEHIMEATIILSALMERNAPNKRVIRNTRISLRDLIKLTSSQDSATSNVVDTVHKQSNMFQLRWGPTKKIFLSRCTRMPISKMKDHEGYVGPQAPGRWCFVLLGSMDANCNLYADDNAVHTY